MNLLRAAAKSFQRARASKVENEASPAERKHMSDQDNARTSGGLTDLILNMCDLGGRNIPDGTVVGL